MGRVKQIRTALAAVVISGVIAVPQMPVFAQDDHQRDRQEDRRDYERDRPPRSEWRHYDHSHYEPGQHHYDAARYYHRDEERNYQVYRLRNTDRIYRGTDDRYYCRRSDGTTGLIVGGLAGGVLGNIIAPGDSKTLGTIIGAAGGAVVGRSIDRNNVTCR